MWAWPLLRKGVSPEGINLADLPRSPDHALLLRLMRGVRRVAHLVGAIQVGHVLYGKGAEQGEVSRRETV